MKISPPSRIYLAIIALAIATIGCRLAAGLLGNETTAPTPPGEAVSADITPTEAAPPTELPPTTAPPTEEPSLPEPTALPEATSPAEPLPTTGQEESCTDDVCVFTGYLSLLRPIGGEGRLAIDPSSRFGIYRPAREDSIRGVYFLNSTGTPVVAAADGKVIVAGDDSQSAYGRFRNTYGNLVIIQHKLPGFSGRIFTLYGHLSEVLVRVNDQVSAGERIGSVGGTGNVSGSTLLFEVRQGDNSYQSVRNPELWMAPLSDGSGQPQGAIAGRIVDADGNYVEISNIVIEELAGKKQPALDTFYTRTYTGKSLIGQGPFEENFAIGDLPPGPYQVTFSLNGFHQQEVEVVPGGITLVTFVLP